MKTYATVFFGAALVAIFAMPVLTRLARRLGLVDRPGVRKVHKTPVPRIGGVVIVLAMLALTIPVFLLSNTIGDAFRKIQTQCIVLMASSLLMFAVGVVDDIRGVRAEVKLLAQVVAATAVCAAGSRFDSVTIGDWLHLDLGFAAWPLTVAWIVTITNAINLIDGLDGLASGISSLTCGVIAAFALYEGQVVMAVIMLALLGSLVGFLFFNFNPAKIFLGDSGTLFVGFLIGGSSVMCAVKSATLVGLALPALALGVPIFDTLFSILRRILERRSIFAPDKGHIHHRLLSFGLSQRRAVAVMYAVTGLAAGAGMFMMFVRDIGALGIFACATGFVLLLFRLVGAVRLRDTFAAIHRNLERARGTSGDNRIFEMAQLCAREAESFEGWWQAACVLAAQLDFARLAVSVTDQAGTSLTHVWRRDGPEPPREELMTVTIPIRRGGAGTGLQIEAAIAVNGSLESTGHRAELLGRLIDECRAALPTGEDTGITQHLRVASELGGASAERGRDLGLYPQAYQEPAE